MIFALLSICNAMQAPLLNATAMFLATLVGLAFLPTTSPNGLDPWRGVTHPGRPKFPAGQAAGEGGPEKLAWAARALEDQGKDAASAYVAALERHPRDHTLLHNYAQLRAQSDPSAALELYQRALDADPAHAETLNSLGKLLCSIGDNDAGEHPSFN